MSSARKATTTVSTKGQVILPKAIRDARNWGPGARLVVEGTTDGVLLRAERPFAQTDPEDVFGCLDPKGKHVRIEDFDKAIANEVRKRHARGRY
jgi:AbrB family looped-hinge helix DNA binding protein